MPTGRPAKRSRVSRACDQCRTAREKCDGTQPTCLTCSASKRSCTYTTAPKKRGIQPGYIRVLELALTWLFQNNDSEALLNRKLAREGNLSTLLARDSKESNKLHKSWRRSKFYRDVDKLLSGEQLGPGDERSPASEDEDSDLEIDAFDPQNQLPVVLPEEDLSPSLHFTSPNRSRPIAAPSPVVGNSPNAPNPLDAQSGAATVLPPGSWRLLDMYFAFTQSWLPICEKHDILRVSYSYPDAGLILSSMDVSNSADHAELWSVLAVAAHQAKFDPRYTDVLPDPRKFYDIARSLVPMETGSFEVGHVKALLNLAVVNLGQANTKAAWLLVGAASRILSLIQNSSQSSTPRWKHLFAGCYLMDGFISLQLCARPYLKRSIVENIEEDGIEEWQPWLSPIHPPLATPSRTPVLSLSSFNQLLDITDTLSSSNLEQPAKSGLSSQQLLSRLESWKATLPAKFDYISNEHKQTPSNPPALLLQLTYLYSIFALLPSPIYLHRILDLLERYQDQLGAFALPPVVLCLLEHMQMSNAYCMIEERLQVRLQSIVADIKHAWTKPSRDGASVVPDHASVQTRSSLCAYQVPTPESIQIPFGSAFTSHSNRPASSQHRATASFIDDLLPDVQTATSASQASAAPQNFSFPPLENRFRRPRVQHRNSVVPNELETFFDELASLDGAEKVDNQPQFMQNLGFAPDANMADFLAAEFGQFIPANSTTFMPQNSDDPTQLDPAFFGTT